MKKSGEDANPLSDSRRSNLKNIAVAELLF